MACPNLTYPSTTNQQAIDLNIHNSNQFHILINGGVTDEIETCEGNGNLPSWAKALNERATYKTPLAWAVSSTETDLTQPRTFNDQIYVPLRTPALMDTSPDNNWSLYSFTNIFSTEVDSFANALAGDFTNEDRVIVQSYSASTNVGKGGFTGVKTGGSGTAGTGTCLLWYDNVGNEFILEPTTDPNAYMFGINDDGTDQGSLIDTTLTDIEANAVHSTILFHNPAVAWGLNTAVTPPSNVTIIGEDRKRTIFRSLSATGRFDLFGVTNVSLYNFTLDKDGFGANGIETDTSSSFINIDQVEVIDALVRGFRLGGDKQNIGTIYATNCVTSAEVIFLDDSEVKAIISDSGVVDISTSVRNKFGLIRSTGTGDANGSVQINNGASESTFDVIQVSGAHTVGDTAIVVGDVSDCKNLHFGTLQVSWTGISTANNAIKFDEDLDGVVVDSIQVSLAGTSNYESVGVVDVGSNGGVDNLTIKAMTVIDDTATNVATGTRFVNIAAVGKLWLSGFTGNKFVVETAVPYFGGTKVLNPNTMQLQDLFDGDYTNPLATVAALFVGQEFIRYTPDPDGAGLDEDVALIEVWRSFGTAAGEWSRVSPDSRIRYRGQGIGAIDSGNFIQVRPGGSAVGGGNGRDFLTFEQALDAVPVGIPTTINLDDPTTINADFTLYQGQDLQIKSNGVEIDFQGFSVTVKPGATLRVDEDFTYTGTAVSPIILHGGNFHLSGITDTITAPTAATLAPIQAGRGAKVFIEGGFAVKAGGTIPTIENLDSVSNFYIYYGETTSVGSGWTVIQSRTFAHNYGKIALDNSGNIVTGNTRGTLGVITNPSAGLYRVTHNLGTDSSPPIDTEDYSIQVSLNKPSGGFLSTIVRTATNDYFEVATVNSSNVNTDNTVTGTDIYWSISIV